MTTSFSANNMTTRPTSGVLLTVVLCSIMLPQIPVLNLLIAPMVSLSTIVHEMSHALACLLTGGSVQGMTIVPDGMGHGGLTFCRGGIAFIYGQAGYLGTAIVGCALIALARFPHVSKGALFALGAAFGIASLTFMFGTVLHGGIMQGLASMLVGLAMSAGFIYVSLKLNVRFANLLLLFVGVQLGLNSLIDSAAVVKQSFGFGSGMSDATVLAGMTGIPAPFWAILWSFMAVAMLVMTLIWTYKPNNKS